MVLQNKKLEKNILRNAFIPYVNYVGVTIPSFFWRFNRCRVTIWLVWFRTATRQIGDGERFPIINGGVLIIGVVVVVSLFIIDVLMVVINPKLRRGVLRC